MAGVCLIKIRGEGVKVLRGGVLGGLQRPGWDGGAETPLQSLPTPGPASKCPLRGDDPWEAEPQAALRAQETGADRTHLRHISPVSVMLGCQILVKHFTLGGCNTEGRDHRCSRAFCVPHPAPFYRVLPACQAAALAPAAVSADRMQCWSHCGGLLPPHRTPPNPGADGRWCWLLGSCPLPLPGPQLWRSSLRDLGKELCTPRACCEPGAPRLLHTMWLSS